MWRSSGLNVKASRRINEHRAHSALYGRTPQEAWEGQALPEPIPLRARDQLQPQIEVRRRHYCDDPRLPVIEISVKLAAARLRTLLAERERRRAGWDEGLERRREARARLDGLDERVQGAADDRARAVWALQEAEGALRLAAAARSEAEAELRHAVEAESAARQALAAEATRGVRLTALDEDLKRVQGRIAEIATELEIRERELEEAERGFREAQERRREVEEERRRISEEAAAHRAEVETLRRSLAGHDRDRQGLEAQRLGVSQRGAEARARAETLSAEIERLDAATAPLAERSAELERERHGLAGAVTELEEAVRLHEHRRDVLDARLKDLEETPGSRFLDGHRGRAIGLLGGLVEADQGWERALAAGLGPLADAVVYARGEDAVADAPEGDGAILAVAAGGPGSFVLEGERTLLSVVAADPVARGLVTAVLRDIYLADSVQEAAAKHARHPKAAFVTSEGVLVGPIAIRTTRRGDSRAAEIRRELSVVEHDLARARSALRPKRERVAEIQSEIDSLAARIEGNDAEITLAAEELSRVEADQASLAREEDVLAQRIAGMDDAAAAWRERLAQAEPVTHELPELPALAEPPIQARVAVETLRRDRAGLESRLSAVRAELESLAAQDPAALRASVATAEGRRVEAEVTLQGAEGAAHAAEQARDVAATAEREATEAEAEVNRSWREASTELDRLREEYQDEDRSRGDLERRIRDAERLLVEGHQADPQEAIALLSDEDGVESLEKRAELVQRRLGLLGRVNLLASGELDALQERHDFLARELEDVRKARRDLLEVIARIEQEITVAFESALRDVAAEFERLFAELFPGGEGRLISTEPGDPLNTGIEIEARPGRKRVKRISLLSGGERALTAMAFLFAIFRARPSPFYLMDEVEPALDDVNLHRFLKLLDGFAADSQVLIVTHQKRTMEIAGMMYGVSMGKDGTSRVIAQRLDQPGVEAEVGVERIAAPVTVPEPDAVR